MRFLTPVLVFLFVAQSAMAADIQTNAKQMILVDDATGTVLMEKNADEKMHPSSMSKLMTILIVFTLVLVLAFWTAEHARNRARGSVDPPEP